MRKTEVQRPRGFPSRPTRDGNLSRKTLTRSEWWPQRDSNPCSHTAARFCQRINDLRRVESTTTAGGRKPSRPLVAGGAMSRRQQVRLLSNSVSGCCSYFALGGHWPQVFAGRFERNLGGAGILRDQERMKDSSWQARRAWKSSCVSPEYLAIGRPLKQEQLPNASFANVLPNVLP